MLQSTIDHMTRAARHWAELIPGPEHEVEWTTGHRVALRTPALTLRDFGGGAPGSEHPLLMVAPEVNGSNLLDYGPGQSLVQVAKAAGFGRVCVLHWEQITAETAGRDIDDSIADIVRCIDALGGRAHLLGVCQGGWESAIVAALWPEKVASLTLAGAAIDFRAGEGAITRLVDRVPQVVYEGMVASSGGVMRGQALRFGFDALQALNRWVIDRIQLWNRIDDPEYMERRHRMERWYRVRKDLPGPMYLRVVQDLFRENKLIAGELAVLGRTVDLGDVVCPVAMVAGTEDHITLPEQVWAIDAAVSSERTERFEVPGGHIGLVIGGQAQRRWWPDVFSWIREGEQNPAPEAPTSSRRPRRRRP